MPFATATLNKFVDAFHGKTTYTAPANIYAALSTTTPTTAGANITEPSGNAYARVAVPGSSYAAASSGSGANTTAITFPTPTGSWGTVTHVVFFDASTAGNMISFDDLPAPQAIASGVAVSIAVGQATDALA